MVPAAWLLCGAIQLGWVQTDALPCGLELGQHQEKDVPLLAPLAPSWLLGMTGVIEAVFLRVVLRQQPWLLPGACEKCSPRPTPYQLSQKPPGGRLESLGLQEPSGEPDLDLVPDPQSCTSQERGWGWDAIVGQLLSPAHHSSCWL